MIVASRKADYAGINDTARAEARDIFIHSALLQGELTGRYPFLDNNQKLIARFEKIEDRLRQRNVLADDYVLYKFYDSRLDLSVFDRASLNRYLKNQGDDKFLFMTEQDILIESPESDKLSDFPKKISMGNGFSLKLSYCFDPGGEADGVSVMLPVELLDHVSPELFDWLVPGLLSEKVLFLLKGLPKNLRKQLIPIQQTAEDVSNKLTIYKGSLYRELELHLSKYYKVKISRNQWPVKQIPPHLKIRYILHDSSGKTIMTGRNFSELQSDRSNGQESSTLDELREKWERTGITTWDFENLPEKIPLQSTGKKLLGFAYPCLHKDNQGNIAIKLSVDPVESRRMNKEGLLSLYSMHFPKQFKLLKKECALPSSSWALYEGLGSRQELSENVYQFVLNEIFSAGMGSWPEKETFFNIVDTIKKEGVFNRTRELIKLVLDLLQERRETIDQINRMKDMSRIKKRTTPAMKKFREELSEIVPVDFLQQFNAEQMASAVRYCKALQIRMERAYASPEKDTVKAARVSPFVDRLKKYPLQDPSPECSKLLQEYRNMLAEFKISVFAQEMKTLIPVSSKRLEKKWQEIINNC